MVCVVVGEVVEVGEVEAMMVEEEMRGVVDRVNEAVGSTNHPAKTILAPLDHMLQTPN